MQKNEFTKQFFEILAGSKLNFSAKDYDDSEFNFDVKFSSANDITKATFLGEHSIFPIIIEIPEKDHLMVNGLYVSLYISGKKYNQKSRVPHFSKLIFNYLESNQLIEIDNLGNIEIKKTT